MFQRSNNIDNISIVLAELNAGIVPTSVFLKNLDEEKDTFAEMNKQQARAMKRKWRKLKKKFGVKNCGISSAAWRVRKELEKESNETS